MFAYHILGGNRLQPGLFGDADKRTYECHVSLTSHADHRLILTDYLKYYCDCDVEKYPELEWQVMTNANCVLALLTYYFRGSGFKFEETLVEEISPTQLPTNEPIEKSATHRIWVLEKSIAMVDTPKSAAWMLFSACGGSKISVKDAREMVARKYPAHVDEWEKILYEFRRYGGRDTDKYLRHG